MRSQFHHLIPVALGILLFLSPTARAADPVSEVKIDIPFQKFVLTNGLTLIVHEDHKAPIVAVNLWYHVGSKNEKPGKTGFAHLFEHLMFTGSGHFKGTGDQRAFFEAMERVGATDLNGTTEEDRTDFFENVPKDALEVALWLESDRMGHLLDAVDQMKLDTQRGVVQNEKRQDENQPYAVADELITKGTAPVGHPYSWTVIGSMEDLNAASLEDVRAWFRTYYGAANAVLVLAGDIDAETARQKVERYFGSIPSGPPVARFQKWIPQIEGQVRQTATDRVPQPRLYQVWNVPCYGEADTVYLGLVADVLAQGKSSRLYKRLVYDEQLATEVSAEVDAHEISSQFVITVTAKAGGDLDRIEADVNQELQRLLDQGATPEELQRAKTGEIAQFVTGIERIGGFGGKSDILAMNQTYRGDPGFYQTILKYTREATPENLTGAARKWLTDNVYVLGIHPFPDYEATSESVDRSRLPTPTAPPEVVFPTLQRTQLANGLKIVLAERHATPMVRLTLQVDAGYASDQLAAPGTARLAMETMDEGTAHRTALQISDELESLGATLGAGSDLDSSSVSLSTLTATLDPALNLYADIILNPAFPEADFQRRQKELLAAIDQEKSEPSAMTRRVFPALLYGHGHAYANPFTGSGTETSVNQLTRADLEKFHETWFHPNNATLIIVGDTTLNEITPKLESLFADWKPAQIPAKNIGAVALPAKRAIYLVDRPGSLQSMIFAGSPAPPRANPQEIALETMNTVLGGTFSSRVNLNLREAKHWSYGVHSMLMAASGQRPFALFAPVQTDKTKESMVELDKELRGIVGDQPITDKELQKAQDSQTLRLPGSWETLPAMARSVGEIVRFGLPDDYFNTYPEKVRALTLDSLAKAAAEVVHPDQMIWVVVGDRSKIESGIRELGWGEIQFIDADGQPVK
jgi:zinc protease